MIRKTDLVREYVRSGEYKRALQICKGWTYNDASYSKQLSLGYECLMYPEFYSQIGYDTDREYQRAVELLLELYG